MFPSFAMLNRLWLGPALAALLAAPAPAAETFEVLFGQLEAKIALSEAMEAEGKRQAAERIAELQQWIGWWEGIQALVQAKQADLEKTLAARASNAALMVGTLRGLTQDPKAERYLPNYGWVTLETAAALETSIALEIRQLRDAIQDGRDNWHIVALGWIAGGAVQTRIDALEEEIRQIQAGVTSGEYTFHSAFGWQKLQVSRDMAAQQRAELAAIKDQIAKGTYVLDIPGLGRLTRNDLEARLAETEAAIDALKKQGAAGEFGIFRPSVDWVTRNQLQARLDETQASYEAAEALLTQGLFTVHIAGAGGGFWTKQQLEDQIAAFDKTIEEVRAAIDSGDYGARVMGDFYSLKQLTAILEDRERRLGDPNLNQMQRNQLSEQIDAAHKAIKEWRDLSAFDLTIKALDKTQYLAWVGWVMKLAKPDFDSRTLKRAEQSYHLGSFEGELALRLRPLEAQRDAYLAARAWFAAP